MSLMHNLMWATYVNAGTGSTGRLTATKYHTESFLAFTEHLGFWTTLDIKPDRCYDSQSSLQTDLLLPL